MIDNEFLKFNINLIENKNLFIDHEINNNNETVLTTTNDKLLDLLQYLRDKEDLRFRILADICCIDYLYNKKYQKRFCIIYNLLSIKFNKRIFVQIFTNDFEKEPDNYEISSDIQDLNDEMSFFNQEKHCGIKKNNEIGINSVSYLFSSAIWLEREVYDMFGIIFFNMKDNRRILNDYGFKGFPLRKDFPLSGYKQKFYNEINEEVEYEDLKLDQEYRNFNFRSSWSGK